MEACGVVVEYNPFHRGHLYHLKKAKEITEADCLIAVMSGPFLQRGEPALIDKFHRTRAALQNGADIVIELPYAFAVQSSQLFAKGALLSLNALGVSSICFGSESGKIQPFIDGVKAIEANKNVFDTTVRSFLKKGLSFPEANQKAYETIGLTNIDMMQPNNILGFSYVQTIIEHRLSITPCTIQRIKSNFHDETITQAIASATSIRKELLSHGLTEKISQAVPNESLTQIKRYKEKTSLWHDWERYFPLLHYQLQSKSIKELSDIHGMTEGLEYRLKRLSTDTTSFDDLVSRVKTRRYTQTRLQRLFTHILTNSKKAEIEQVTEKPTVSYIRLLGLSKVGQTYIHTIKKSIPVPVWSNLNHKNANSLMIDERASNVYYTVLSPEKRNALRKQEFSLPIFTD